MEANGTCSLELSSGFILQLKKTFYVPSVSRNLISVSTLVPFGIFYNFLNNDESKTHMFLRPFFLQFLELNVQYNADLWNLHTDLCFVGF